MRNKVTRNLEDSCIQIDVVWLVTQSGYQRSDDVWSDFNQLSSPTLFQYDLILCNDSI
jgi:hypothetical protein